MADVNEDMHVKKNEEKDEELEQLLNSALEDFEKTAKQAPINDASKQSTSQASNTKEQNLWNDEFSIEAQKQFEEKLKLLFNPVYFDEFCQSVRKNYLDEKGEDVSFEQFGEQLQKMAEEAANSVLSEHSRGPEFSETIAQTLRSLSEDTEKMNEMDPETLTRMLGGLDLGSEGNVPGDFMPFMQSMMQSLLSKDVLYPSIKEITEKYPGWLEMQRNKLNPTEYDNYTKQFKLMDEVCIEFESESENDSDETKKMRFNKILSLMDEMQKLGQPPEELVSNTPFSFNENGLPNPLAGMDMSQCSLM